MDCPEGVDLTPYPSPGRSHHSLGEGEYSQAYVPPQEQMTTLMVTPGVCLPSPSERSERIRERGGGEGTPRNQHKATLKAIRCVCLPSPSEERASGRGAGGEVYRLQCPRKDNHA